MREGTTYACAMCGGDEMAFLGRLGRAAWYRCRDCGMLAMGPDPCEDCPYEGGGPAGYCEHCPAAPRRVAAAAEA